MATAIGLRAEELSRGNPWWRDPANIRNDSDLREVDQAPLKYEPDCLEGLEAGGLYILRGPRRVGKTVAVKQTIRALLAAGVNPRAIVQVAVDGWDAKDLRTVATNTALPKIADGEIRYWFIDEISAVTGDWAQQIKWLRDNDDAFRHATVVLTGSDATALTEATGVLAGRRGAIDVDRVLMPMGFRTFVKMIVPRGDIPDLGLLGLDQLHSHDAQRLFESSTPWLSVLTDAWERYLQYGGFPQSVAAAVVSDPIPSTFVDAMFHVIFRDAFGTSRLPEATAVALLARLWDNLGSPSNLTSVGEELGISKEVVGRHVGYLHDSYLLWECQRVEESGGSPTWTPVPGAQRKLYATDPVLARLPHLRNSRWSDPDITALTEMQIGMAIRRRILTNRTALAPDESVFYYRTPSRKEVDFVSEYLGKSAIEGKYVERGSWASEAATVNASPWRGILVTRNVLDVAGRDAWAVPAGTLAFVIDN